jgi:hypothetical protein
MQKRNWRKYNRQLVERGSIYFLIDPKLFKQNKKHKCLKKRGRPKQFSDEIIQLLLMIKIRYRLSYRALEGFAKSIFKGKEFLVPTYSLECKRVTQLKLQLESINTGRGFVVILDGSGLKVYGEGEWKVKIHGRGRPRKWIKLHLALDADTQEILAEWTTDSAVADSAMTKALLDAVPGKVTCVIADGAYDRASSRDAIRKKKAKALIPPPKNARYKYTDSERDQAIAAIQGLGGDRDARSIWGKLSGYNRRVLVETAFSRMKRLFGDRLFSQLPDKQIVENTARCMLLNRLRA